jgi:hypothetical protein
MLAIVFHYVYTILLSATKGDLLMNYIKTIVATSGHAIAIFKVDSENHPGGSEYTHYYIAKNFDKEGVTFFYLAKGYKDAKDQIHVWYRNKKMWSGFGTNFQTAIAGAQSDGWLAAE